LAVLWTQQRWPRAFGRWLREGAQSWKELLLQLKRRGLLMGPELAVADGALGFWQAIEEVWMKRRVPFSSGVAPMTDQ
jgi:hypothetical protein